MADIKTSKLVEPADMNGSGKPVGEIEPLTSVINFALKKEQNPLFFINMYLPYHKYHLYLLLKNKNQTLFA